MSVRLGPDTDASTLRVAQLRAILHEHGVVVPGKERKSALVAAFNEHIRPTLQSEKHEQPEAPTKPKSEVSVEHELPKNLAMRIGTPSMRRISTESASSTSSPPPLADTASDNHFSDDNPFQRASTTPLSRKKRSSTPSVPSAMRRMQATPKSTPVSKSACLSTPMHTISPHTRSPERVQALASSAQEPSETALPQPAQRAPVWEQVRSHWQGTLVRWSMWLAVLFWIWYCWQSRLEGYCQSGTVHMSENPKTVWEAIQRAVHPECTPCPEHGICAGGRLETCDSSDRTVEEPIQARVPVVAQMIPLAWGAARCVPDTYRLVLASELADALVEYLARHHGQVRCKLAQARIDAPIYEPLGRFSLPEVDVKRALQERTTDEVDGPTFEAIWIMVMDGLLEHAPGDMHAIQHGGKRWLVSRRKIMPFMCRLRLYVIDWAWRHSTALLTILFVLFGTFTLSRSVQRTRIRKQAVATYAQVVFEQLQRQAAQAVADSSSVRGLPVTHLRDIVMQSEPNPNARRDVWKDVTKVVERNANVRTRQAQWYGEWQRVWEWIGISGSASPARKETATPPPEEVPTPAVDAPPTTPPVNSSI